MTNDELKNKIAKFICNACEMGLGAGFNGDECAINQNYWECGICGETAAALIAAGIGDVKETELKANRYERLYNMQAHDMVLAERKAHEAEHRAEVAERALKIAVIELLETRGYSALMAAIRAEEFFIPEAIKEAEKELLEESKDD